MLIYSLFESTPAFFQLMSTDLRHMRISFQSDMKNWLLINTIISKSCVDPILSLILYMSFYICNLYIERYFCSISYACDSLNSLPKSSYGFRCIWFSKFGNIKLKSKYSNTSHVTFSLSVCLIEILKNLANWIWKTQSNST